MNNPITLIHADEVDAPMQRAQKSSPVRNIRLGKIFGFLAVVLGVVGNSNAQTFTTWNNSTSTSYSTGGNWDNSTPSASKIALFDSVILNGGNLGIASTISNAQALVITSNYTGNLNIGASGTTGANLTYSLTGNATIDGVSNVSISNNSSNNLTINPKHTSGNNTLILTLGNATNNVIRVANSGNVTINAGITGANPLTVSATGSGRVTFNGTNTYTGATAVRAGTLALGSAGSITGGSVLSIAAGATLDLKAKTSFTLNNPLTIDVGASNAGKLDAMGVALIYGNALTLNITTSTPLSTYNLFAFTSETGDFNSINLNGSFSGSMAGSSGNWTATSNGYDFTFNESTGVLAAATAAVPEPGTWALFGIGAAFFLHRLSRKKSIVSLRN